MTIDLQWLTSYDQRPVVELLIANNIRLEKNRRRTARGAAEGERLVLEWATKVTIQSAIRRIAPI